MRRGRLAIFAAAALASCAWGKLQPGFHEGGEVVEVEGWAPVDPADLLGTRRRSLADAQRKAVERVLGVYISAKTRVSQAAKVEQNILAKGEGYVRRYDVLSEKAEGGFAKTRIRALVLYKRVGEDLKRLGVMSPPPPGDPRILVLVREAGLADKGDPRAAAALRRGLLERGFSVIDRSDPDRFRALKSTENATALSEAKRLGADILVHGEAEVHPITGIDLAGFQSCRARVAVEAVKPATGELLGRKSQEASALDPSPEIAAAKALEAAGLMVGEELAGDLAQGLRARVTVSLVVTGVPDLAEARGFADDLRLQPEIESVSLAEYRAEGVRFTVATEGIAGDELAALVLRMRRRPLTVSSVTPYEVEVRLPK